MARGSVRRRSEGSYEIRWEGAVGPDGKRRQRSKTLRGVTKKQAQAELRREQDEAEKTDAEREAERASTLLVKDCCQLFLEESGKGKLQPRSIEGYENFFKNFLLPQCGDMRVVSVGRSDLQSVINAMSDNGLQGVTIKVMGGLMSGFFSWTVRAEHLEKSPVRDLTMPEPSGESTAQILSVPDVVNMLAVLEGTECWLPTFLCQWRRDIGPPGRRDRVPLT